MVINIGSNLTSIKAQRRLGEASNNLSKVYERLSSGQRINRASDDAAGLSISMDLNAKSRIFAQAIRNANDGISLHAIADGTISELDNITIRLKELSEQSANGTFSNLQRKAIDTEAQQLAKEYFRISRSTEFNGQKLFDGSASDGIRLQVGVGVEGSLLTHIGGRLGDGTLSSQTTMSMETHFTYDVKLADLNGDSFLDIVSTGDSDSPYASSTIRLGDGNGSFGNAISYIMGSFRTYELAIGDLNGDGIYDIVSAGVSNLGTGEAYVRLGTGRGTFAEATSYLTEVGSSRSIALGDLNGDGNIDLVTAGDGAASGVATVRLGTGSGSFGASSSYITETGETRSVALEDLNRDGVLDLVTAGVNSSGSNGYATVRLGTGNGTFGSAISYLAESAVATTVALGDLNGDGNIDLVTSGSTDGVDGYNGSTTIRLGSGNGTFGVARSYITTDIYSSSIILSDLNGDNSLDLIAAGASSSYDGYLALRMGNGDGTFGSVTAVSAEEGESFSVAQGDLNSDGVSDFVSSGTDDSAESYIKIYIANTRDGVSPLQPFSLKTKAEALQAIGLFSKNLENLTSLRGILGSNQSRLNAAISNLTTLRENNIAASSRITDVDISGESANLLQTQILQQASSAILAQANQQPKLALQLLNTI